MKRYDDDGMRLTDCCGAHSTYSQSDATLCCKACWHEVSIGEGDGNHMPTWTGIHTVLVRDHHGNEYRCTTVTCVECGDENGAFYHAERKPDLRRLAEVRCPRCRTAEVTR